VLVYVGAVMVLFLFVVMMLDINIDRVREGFWSYLPLGTIVGLVMVLELGAVLGANYLGVLESAAPQTAAIESNTKALGRLIYTDFVYPFELASVILLVAIVAAIAITYRGRKPTKATDPAKQLRVRAQDRMRVLQMPAEKQD
jgi:NADH-quinone oxidoreductase subunit J